MVADVVLIPTVRSFIAGNSGSGKTTLAWRLYLSQVPRFIVVDQIGEWSGKVDMETDTLPELVNAIRELSKRGKWSVSYSLSDDRLPDLIQWLIPLPDVAQSPVIALGGLVLLNDEVDLIAPFGPPPPYIRTLYRRSRHVGLSVLSLTSVPANVSKEVTRQSTHRIALFLDEPSDLKYMADAMRLTPEQQAKWHQWVQRYPHGAAFREVLTGRLLWLPEDGKPVSDQQASVLLDVAHDRQQQPPQQQPLTQQPVSKVVIESSEKQIGDNEKPTDDQNDDDDAIANNSKPTPRH